MAYAAAANKEKPSFYVAKSWHNRFAGPRGANLSAASKKFKVKIKLAPRETSDTGVYVDGKPNEVEEVRKYFEGILGFTIGVQPLSVQKCKIVPLEITTLTKDRDSYIEMVKKYGVAVAFPRKGTDGLTMIQGRSADIKSLVIDFGKILQREIKFEAQEEQKNDDGGNKKLAVSHRRFNKAHSRLNLEMNEVLFFHPREDDDPDFERFLEVLCSADHNIDVCVFTITDNRIRYALADEARSGVKVRLITDNSQAEALGSDAHW
eukprot:CAMPEP_0201594300 /NCGR_PEP_ID=MMETSP0190_2-20130828/191656_1 /ASSEMBLY_ACC=CAM_ASM_000263 /TAXON_ID=37353 /ORGANISM="Rosalina sp." /LENGTH=262 /DNA_ID=CAMNT_0048053851 /DNA_START=15 /DNA_END=800 /DNA_ORIENTATION=-